MYDASVYERDEQDELDSAIYGQQAGVSAPQPQTFASSTPTGAGTTGPAPTGQNFADAVRQQQPQAPQAPQAPTAPTMGGDMFAAIYDQGSQGSQQPPAQESIANADTPTRTGTATPGGQAKPGDVLARYHDAVSRVQSAGDPMAQAQARNALSRQLAADFTQAGHDVSWDGDVLVVDGLRYTVAGGGSVAGTGAMSSINRGPNGEVIGPDGQVVPDTGAYGNGQLRPGDPAPSISPVTSAASSAVPAGYDAAKWADPNHHTAKYDVTRGLFDAGIQDQLRAIPDEAGRKAFMEQTIRGMADVFAASGAQLLDVQGEKAYISTPDMGPHWVDMVQDIEGGATLQWHVDQPGAPTAGPGAPPIVGVDSPGAAGFTPGAGAPGPMPAPPAATPGFTPTGPTYTPGEIGLDDIPDFDAATLAWQMGQFTPDRYEVGDLSVGAAEGDVDALVRSILANPESLDAQTIERMKVGAREDAADQLKMDDDELTALGFDLGIEDSAFLASQRLGARSRANETIQRGNRAVDIEAARTNAADRRAAAGVGSAHLAEVGARRRGDETLRQSAAAMNNQNAFNAAKLQSDNVTNAAKLSLDAAAQRGDRMALRESVNQAAAELGISRDKLMLDYVTSTRDDLTRRYGIDVDAALKREGLSVDWATLNQRGAEFQQELAFKLKQLAMQHEVDMGGLGLGWGTLQQRANEADMDWLGRAIYG